MSSPSEQISTSLSTHKGYLHNYLNEEIQNKRLEKNTSERHFLWWARLRDRRKYKLGFSCSNMKTGKVKWISLEYPSMKGTATELYDWLRRMILRKRERQIAAVPKVCLYVWHILHKSEYRSHVTRRRRLYFINKTTEFKQHKKSGQQTKYTRWPYASWDYHSNRNWIQKSKAIECKILAVHLKKRFTLCWGHRNCFKWSKVVFWDISHNKLTHSVNKNNHISTETINLHDLRTLKSNRVNELNG